MPFPQGIPMTNSSLGKTNTLQGLTTHLASKRNTLANTRCRMTPFPSSMKEGKNQKTIFLLESSLTVRLPFL